MEKNYGILNWQKPGMKLCRLATAICFGGNVVDRFQLNSSTLWYDGFHDRINPDAKENIPKIRQLIREGKT